MKILLPFLAVMLFFSASTQIPAGYYDPAAGLTGNNLRMALNNIIQDHTEFPYNSGGTDVWDILKETDKDTINTNDVVLLYSGWTLNGAQEYNGGSGWNREHVWPQSRGDFGTSAGPGTDVHALRPCDISVNSQRANRWFAECSEEYIDSDGATGSYYSSTDWVWKPRDEVKGDVARMIFYMATRYDGENGEPDLMLIDIIPSNNGTSAPIHAKITDLLQWNADDPVNDWERNRNDIIYYSYQNNRNPFIDHPEYAMDIWGIYLNTPEIELEPKLVVYPNPTQNQITIRWAIKDRFDLVIYDLTGKVVHAETFEPGENTSVDLEHLPRGAYKLNTLSTSHFQTTKLILH